MSCRSNSPASRLHFHMISARSGCIPYGFWRTPHLSSDLASALRRELPALGNCWANMATGCVVNGTFDFSYPQILTVEHVFKFVQVADTMHDAINGASEHGLDVVSSAPLVWRSHPERGKARQVRPARFPERTQKISIVTAILPCHGKCLE